MDREWQEDLKLYWFRDRDLLASWWFEEIVGKAGVGQGIGIRTNRISPHQQNSFRAVLAGHNDWALKRSGDVC